jgi:hypothetical protein
MIPNMMKVGVAKDLEVWVIGSINEDKRVYNSTHTPKAA